MREPSDSDIAVGSAEAARVSPPVSSLRGKARVGAGNPSGAATLVFAVSAAVSLGIACGVWINSRLASAASASLPPLAMLPSDARATPAPTLVGEPRPGHSHDTPSAVAAPAPPPATGEAAAAGDGGARSQPANSGVAAARPGGTGPRPNPVAPSDVEPAVGAKASPATARSGPAPCALYASASSLTLRGGAAILIVGGPGVNGHAAVTTPDWADIAVFSEGPTGGNRGWMKYSVRSVSRRAGVYAVHFRTPCGSQTIPVKVTSP